MNDCSERGRFEQYRLMVISTWPEGEMKRVAFASARAALEREAAFAEFRHGTTVEGHGPVASTP
jgi:hypothetical protein